MRKRHDYHTATLAPTETARNCVLLIQMSLQIRNLGFCIGLLKPEMLITQGDFFRRTELSRLSSKIRANLLLRKHRKSGHDECCLWLGVPMTTIHCLAVHWGGSGVAALVNDAVMSTTRILMRDYSHFVRRNYEYEALELLQERLAVKVG